jgi:hypothetical protein
MLCATASPSQPRLATRVVASESRIIAETRGTVFGRKGDRSLAVAIYATRYNRSRYVEYCNSQARAIKKYSEKSFRGANAKPARLRGQPARATLYRLLIRHIITWVLLNMAGRDLYMEISMVLFTPDFGSK